VNLEKESESKNTLTWEWKVEEGWKAAWVEVVIPSDLKVRWVQFRSCWIVWDPRRSRENAMLVSLYSVPVCPARESNDSAINQRTMLLGRLIKPDNASRCFWAPREIFVFLIFINQAMKQYITDERIMYCYMCTELGPYAASQPRHSSGG
jgi:hypothetical protein